MTLAIGSLFLVTTATLAIATCILFRKWPRSACGSQGRTCDCGNRPLESAPDREYTEQREALALQLAQQSFQLEQLTHNLQQARSTSSEFLANLSREIRQPLNGILGFSELLLEPKVAAETREIGHTIRRNTVRLMELLSDVLELAQLDSGRLCAETRPCSLIDLLQESLEHVRPQAEAKGLELRVEYPALLPEQLPLDAARLRQTLVNLLSNAVRFTETGRVLMVPRIVGADTAEATLEIDIVDTGIGLGPELQKRLFQPFVRGQADWQTAEGSGLGLLISSRLAELMGGSISVQSKENVGSTFTLALPVGSLVHNLLVDPRKGSRACGRSAADAKQLDCKILVVAHSRDDQRLLNYVLKKAGARVEIAQHGAEGITAVTKAELAEEPFDLVLMDLHMPVLDGFEAVEHLRNSGFKCPVVALTAPALNGDRTRCLEAGCDDYLSKPIDRERLLELATRLTRPAARQGGIRLASVAAG